MFGMALTLAIFVAAISVAQSAALPALRRQQIHQPRDLRRRSARMRDVASRPKAGQSWE